MQSIEAVETKLSGVTFGLRQKVLGFLYKKFKNIGYSNVKIRLVAEDNPHDLDAVSVEVFSEPKNMWFSIGWIPKTEKNGGTPNFNKAIRILLVKEHILNQEIKFVGYSEQNDVYYCVIKIGYSLQ